MLNSTTLQIPRAPRAHTNLRVRPQPHQVRLSKDAITTPTPRHMPLDSLFSNGHIAIIRRA
jgi:hypothetical protein